MKKQSALYTDLSLITANQEIGKEAAEVIAALLKGEVVEKSNLLLVAPKCLQNRVLDMITGRNRPGETGKGRLYWNQDQFPDG